MTFTSRTQLFGALVIFSILSQAYGHSYVTTPISRSDQKQSTSGCRGPACLGPCDTPLANIVASRVVSATRGESLTIDWPRNNHAGGFIRFAWAPTSQSDIMASFDNHVAQINCHEVGGCKPDDPSNPNGGDSAPSDGSYQPCSMNITVPLDLTDGKWTLQWAWFGGAFSLGDYYSCVDYSISGGPTGTLTPVFVGGDYTYPGQQKCKFFNTDKLHQCVDEPCSNPIYPLQQEESGPVAAGQLGASFSPTPAPTVVTTGAMAPVTTGVAAPSTTHSVPAPSTTGAVHSTTAAMAPVTTGVAAPSTTHSVPAPSTTAASPTPASSQCTIGNQRCAGTSEYQTCSPQRDGTGYWAPQQSCQVGLSCHVSGVHIYCY